MPRVVALAGLLTAVVCAADTVTLAGGPSRLTGSVRSIDERGNVELLSEFAAEPLLLKGETVDRIEFGTPRSTREIPSTRIELSNGDILPAIIESLDDQFLTVLSPHAGRLVIPREVVDAMQIGIRSRKLIYEGPGGPNEWADQDGGHKNWVFEERAMIARGPATASRDLELTRQFVIRFTLVWQAGRAPNFKIYFADPMTSVNEPADRYYLQFASAGLEIKRESSKGRRFNTLTILNRSHVQFPDNRLRVEIRVNRDTGRMELLLNNESEGEFADPIPGIPTGAGMTIVCQNRDGSTQEIRDIEVLEHDDSHARNRTETRGDERTDSLISREGDRWSGTLGSIRPLNGELTFFFKTATQDEFMEIPEQDVSTVFLSRDKTTAPTAGEHPFLLRLHHDGSLAVSSCLFGGEAITAVHSLLGPLTLQPGSVAAMERVAAQSEPEP